MRLPEGGLTLTAGFTLSGKFLPVAIVDPHESVAPVVVIPVEWRLDRGAWHPGPFEQIEGDSHDRALHLGIPWLPAGVSQREIGEHEAGNPALLYNIPCRAEDNRSYTVFLKVSRNQTHGLMAHRSERRKKYGIYPVFPAPLQNLGGRLLGGSTLAIVGGHPVESG